MGSKSSKAESTFLNKAVDITKEVHSIEGKHISEERNNEEEEEEEQGNNEDNLAEQYEENEGEYNNENDNYHYNIGNNYKSHESASCSSDLDIKEELMQYKQSLIPKIKKDINSYNTERETYRSNSFSLSKNTLTLIENEMSVDKGLFNNYDQVEINKSETNTINITNHLRYSNQHQSSSLSNGNDSSNKSDYVIKEINKKEELKSSYISKLICSKLNETQPINKASTLIIFDWDDTLLCTTFLTPNGEFDSDKKYNPQDEEKIAKIEISVFKLLTQSIDNGDTYIITNSVPGWVEYSAHRFYPSVETLLDKITIISARGEYEKMYPGDSRMWKIKAFLEMQNKIDANVKKNIICIGDSFIEVEAAKALKTIFNKANIKSVKFRAAPKLEELNKQLALLLDKLNNILAINKSIIMTVEKKQRKGIINEHCVDF